MLGVLILHCLTLPSRGRGATADHTTKRRIHVPNSEAGKVGFGPFVATDGCLRVTHIRQNFDGATIRTVRFPLVVRAVGAIASVFRGLTLGSLSSRQSKKWRELC